LGFRCDGKQFKINEINANKEIMGKMDKFDDTFSFLTKTGHMVITVWSNKFYCQQSDKLYV